MNAQGQPRARTALVAGVLSFVLAAGLTLSAAACTSPPPEEPAADSLLPHGSAPSAEQAATTTPRRDLIDDERRGGHTIARHVARSDAELRTRLRRERRIAAASTYTDLETAERVVGSTLEREADRLRAWLARPAPKPNLVLDYSGRRDEPVGRTLLRDRRDSLLCWDAVVVLRAAGQDDFFVLTSYPERRR